MRTDHASLKWLRNYKDTDGLLARWLTRLQEYDFKVVHRAGKLHGNADGLSRCHACKNPDCKSGAVIPILTSSDSDPEPVHVKKEKVRNFSCDNGLSSDSEEACSPAQKHYQQKLDKEVDKLQWLESYSMEDISSAQRADVHVGLVHEWIRDNLQPSKEELRSYDGEVRILMARRKSLLVRNDILYKSSVCKTGKKYLQIVLPLALRHDVLHLSLIHI